MPARKRLASPDRLLSIPQTSHAPSRTVSTGMGCVLHDRICSRPPPALEQTGPLVHAQNYVADIIEFW